MSHVNILKQVQNEQVMIAYILHQVQNKLVIAYIVNHVQSVTCMALWENISTNCAA